MKRIACLALVLVVAGYLGCPSVVWGEKEQSVQRIQLRSEPLVVSNAEAQQVFGLEPQEAWFGVALRPREYLQNDFEERGDVVVDHATGLMWQQSGSEDGLTYQEAQEYVHKLNDQKFAGYNGWRLPTVPELMSLLEPEKSSDGRYINPIFDKLKILPVAGHPPNLLNAF